METLDIKGFPVETHIAGSGPPLLYLHAEQYFEQVRPHLDALAKNWTRDCAAPSRLRCSVRCD